MMTVVAWRGRVIVSPEGGCGGCWKREPPVNLALSGLDRPQAPVIVKVPRLVGDAWSGRLGSYRRLVEVGMEVGVHPLTQTGGGASLTSLREGRRPSRAPLIAEILKTVGDAWSGRLGSHRLRAALGGRNGGRCCEGVRNHPLTQTGSSTGLTSLREGRGHSAAGLGRPRVPMIVEIHPTHHSGEVGWC